MIVDKLNKILTFVGLTWLTPVVKLAAGENPGQQVRDIWTLIGVPVSAFVAFLMLWSLTAAQIETSLGNIPGPMQAYQQAVVLWEEHVGEREKAQAFYERQQKRNAEKLAANPQAQVKIRQYTGKPTYLDQIGTSLYTVFAGFALASLVAVPLGLFCGMSRTMMNAFNPLVQIFKPVSPLAWLPLVTMVVSALYTTNDGLFAKSFINSAVTVSLCSLWPALINTALGVSSLSQDYVNVARVLNLGVKDRIFKIVLPASLPYIFTGLRISLGVGWMVLIAAEMLAQNPGLGKFVWDEFQNGSSHSLARILVAVLTIGFIGFMLDRAMVILHKLVSFGDEPVST